ncbi:MAG: aminoacetone oxidase family FAD-binding enzyme [Bacteroidota bacterium]|nr:aminoacetone oxidase family FAD-binding enzyme [Bacteroidota bacterium]
MLDVAVIGGGAAGFFAAINIKEKQPHLNVAIFEKTKTPLGKVKISGGGRCNVTHACFDNQELVKYYPRGRKELLSVFEKFNPKDTISWFKRRGVELKIEKDGRMFPESDASDTIIDCFYKSCATLKIPINLQQTFENFETRDNHYEIQINGQKILTKYLVIASGSSQYLWEKLRGKNIPIVNPVPSLFTFNIKNPLINDLMGIVMPKARVSLLVDKNLIKTYKINNQDMHQTGPVLITHWGLSGPGILKLSSIGARILHHLDYQFEIILNMTGLDEASIINNLKQKKLEDSKKKIDANPLFQISSRLWEKICVTCNLTDKKWADISNKELTQLMTILCQYKLIVNGKSTNKDEFVTAGGVDLSSIDFKTMQSKVFKNLFFAGEILDIDALTGGFNFQAAWSEAWIISENIT